MQNRYTYAELLDLLGETSSSGEKKRGQIKRAEQLLGYTFRTEKEGRYVIYIPENPIEEHSWNWFIFRVLKNHKYFTSNMILTVNDIYLYDFKIKSLLEDMKEEQQKTRNHISFAFYRWNIHDYVKAIREILQAKVRRGLDTLEEQGQIELDKIPMQITQTNEYVPILNAEEFSFFYNFKSEAINTWNETHNYKLSMENPKSYYRMVNKEKFDRLFQDLLSLEEKHKDIKKIYDSYRVLNIKDNYIDTGIDKAKDMKSLALDTLLTSKDKRLTENNIPEEDKDRIKALFSSLLK